MINYSFGINGIGGGGASPIPDITANIVEGVDFIQDVTGKIIYNVLVLDALGNKMDINWQIVGNNLVIQSLVSIPNAIIRIITK